MTQTRALTALTLIVLALAGMAALLMPNPAPARATDTDVQMHRISAIPVQAPVVDELVAVTLGAHVGDQGPYTTVQAERVHLAADRVCEGFAAGVPAMTMADTLMVQEGLTDEEAHQFVIDAHRIQCPRA